MGVLLKENIRFSLKPYHHFHRYLYTGYFISSIIILKAVKIAKMPKARISVSIFKKNKKKSSFTDKGMFQ